LLITDTRVETVNLVHYEQCNFMGRLHGGDMLRMLIDTGMLSSIKAAKGTSVLASLDNVVFKKPIYLGDIIKISAQVDYIGNSSMEVEMAASRGEEILVTSTAAYVKIDQNFRPIAVGDKIIPSNEQELKIFKNGEQRRKDRLSKIKKDVAQIDLSSKLSNRISNIFYVSPDMTYDGKVISAGRLLKLMDDLGGILGLRLINYKGYTSSADTVVTVSVSNMSFYSPIKLGDIVQINAGLTYVGKTSMEVLITVMKKSPSTDFEVVTTAFFNYVRVGSDGKPKEFPQYIPQNEYEKKFWDDALNRRRKNFS